MLLPPAEKPSSRGSASSTWPQLMVPGSHVDATFEQPADVDPKAGGELSVALDSLLEAWSSFAHDCLLFLGSRAVADDAQRPGQQALQHRCEYSEILSLRMALC